MAYKTYSTIRTQFINAENPEASGITRFANDEVDCPTMQFNTFNNRSPISDSGQTET